MARPEELLERAKKVRELLAQTESTHEEVMQQLQEMGFDVSEDVGQADSGAGQESVSQEDGDVDVDKLSTELDRLNRQLEKLGVKLEKDTGVKPPPVKKKTTAPKAKKEEAAISETDDAALEDTLDNKPKEAKILHKRSKRHEDKSYLYWWDITPTNAKTLDQYDMVEFIRDDCGKSCKLEPARLKRFLKDHRRTSRGKGNWGVKVLKGRMTQLAFSPGSSEENWLYVKVNWR